MTAALRGVAAACACGLLAACATAPVPAPERPAALPEVSRSPHKGFEQQQRERALASARQGRLADSALAWEVLSVLRPEVGEYRERLADTRRQIDAAVAERLARASQARKRGDTDQAMQLYLAALALDPDNDAAADALRAIERERNKRNHLGKPSRLTLTRKAIADAEVARPAAYGEGSGERNEVEHAAMLVHQGEFDDAIGLLERWLAGGRPDDDARRLLAEAYYLKGDKLSASDPRGAIAAWEKSARLDPDNPRAAARLRQAKRPKTPVAVPDAAKPPAPTR